MTCTDDCRRPVGPRQAHCSACHKTFSGPTWFDLHRIGGACRMVKGLVEENGLWATAEGHAQRKNNAANLAKILRDK